MTLATKFILLVMDESTFDIYLNVSLKINSFSIDIVVILQENFKQCKKQ